MTSMHLNPTLVMHLLQFYPKKSPLNNNVQKRRIRRAVIERATYVYAILAHVAASASDRNKMKARLTCVCVSTAVRVASVENNGLEAEVKKK